MIDQSVKDLWTPTGLILGFQLTLFKWRLEREVKLIDDSPKDRTPTFTYLVPSDYLSILGMLCFVFGVILLPISGIFIRFAPLFFGLGVLFFVGQVLGLAGHYDLYNWLPRRTAYFPSQERIVVVLTILVSAMYVWLYVEQ